MRRRHPELPYVGVVILVVLVANLPYLTGLAYPNPIHWVAGLSEHVRPGILSGWNAADPNTGFTAQALGHRSAMDLLHGNLPWWNPYEGLGAPLAGSMQGAALFPLTLLLSFPNGQVLFYLLLEVIAGVSTYFLLRRLGAFRSAATLAGAAFALNGTFSWFRHASANPVAFLPMLLLGIEMCLDEDDRRWGRGAAVIALAVALSLYAGFPETAYIDGVFAGLWTVIRLVQVRGGGWRPFLTKVAAGGTSGVLLAAPILIAFLDYLPHWGVGSHDAYAFGALPPAGLPMVAVPYIHGPIIGYHAFDKTGLLTVLWGNVGGYTTISLVLLAAVGLAGRSHRMLRVAMAAWTLLVLWRTFTFGDALVAKLFHLVPGFRQVAFYRYTQPTWEMAIVVLAALGLSDVLRRSTRRAWWGASVAFALLVTAASAWGSGSVADRLADAPRYQTWRALSISWAVAVVVVIGVAVLFLRGRSRIVAVSSIVLVDVVAMFVIPQLSTQRDTVQTGGVRFLQANLGTYRFFTLGPIAPNYGSYYGLGSVSINNFPPKSYGEYIRTKLNANVDPTLFTGTTKVDPNGPTPAQEFVRNLPNYEAVGVKYVVLAAGDRLPFPSGTDPLKEVYRDSVMRILELPAPKPYFEALEGDCRLEYSSRTRLRASCDRPTAIVRRELYMPGWEAEADGRSANLSAHQNLFQTFTLPAGTTTVTFGYSPPHLGPAVVAFVIGLVALGLLLRRRSQRSEGTFTTLPQMTSPPVGEQHALQS